MVTIVEGDLLANKITECIFHQTNCTTRNSLGLARSIFSTYPYANVYSDGSSRVLGTCTIRTSPNNPTIVALHAQYYPGKPIYESESSRHTAFESALEDFHTKNQGKYQKLGFPFGIGSGLAGGNWDIYKMLIENFKVSHPEYDIYIFRNH